MPCLRGIDVAIVAMPESGDVQLPEFPHPDGSSVRLSSPVRMSARDTGVTASASNASLIPSQAADHIAKTNPAISVYVPSLPDTRFFFKYTINKAPSEKYLFFKVLVNGRRVVSWGIDLRSVTSNATYRALYQPSEYYDYRDDEVYLRANGIETRHFKFLPETKYKSIAEDGGLIEIQTFRAKGRNCRAPTLESHRSPEIYGIGIISDGLLDKPEEAVFYDYLLVDPKDSPYATFRFHYRSWANLQNLQLIPRENYRFSLPAPHLCSATPENGANHDARVDDGKSKSVDTTIELSPQHAPMRPNWRNTSALLQDAPELAPKKISSIQLPQPSKVVRDGFLESYLQRPLPELPPAECTKEDDGSRKSPKKHSRVSSAASKVSVTPSLQRYIDGESFLGEQFELGVAQQLEVVTQHDPRLPASQSSLVLQGLSKLERSSTDVSLSDYSASPPSSSEHNHFVRQNDYAVTTGDLLEKGVAEYSPARPRSKGSLEARYSSHLVARGAEGGVGSSDLERMEVASGDWARQPTRINRHHNREEPGRVRQPRRLPHISTLFDVSWKFRDEKPDTKAQTSTVPRSRLAEQLEGARGLCREGENWI